MKFGTSLSLGLVLILGVSACGRPSSDLELSATAIQNRTKNPAPIATLASRELPSRQVIRITLQSRAQLHDLAQRGLDLFENLNWPERTIDATVTNADRLLLEQLGIKYRVLKTADQMIALDRFPAGYHTVDEIKGEFQRMAADHPAIAQFRILGKSVDGREIFALRVCAAPDTGLPQILFDSGQHARELPPAEISLRLAATLTDHYDSDAEIRTLVNSRDTWIVPVVNPDGRANVQAGDTYWRKNLRKNSWGARGVDTNRNSDDHWAKGNGNPWADDFHGKAPTSEPETQALRDLVAQNRFSVSVDLHNYAGMVLWPPGFTSEDSPDQPTFSKLGGKMANAIGYESGTIAQTLYNTYGDFSTWQYQKHGIIAFGIELDDPSFNAPFSSVEKDWQAWKTQLLWLISISDDPRKHAANLGRPLGLVRFAGLR